MSYQELLAESRRLFKLIDDLRTKIDAVEELNTLNLMKEPRDLYYEYSLLKIYERHFYSLEDCIRSHEWLGKGKDSCHTKN